VRNTLREALRAGRPLFGSWLQFGHPAIAEVMAQAGFDWIGIDLEHSVTGIETAFSLIQVIELSGCVPLVRLSANDPTQAKRMMDAGAHGAIVPGINSVEDARRAVGSVRYPPQGFRGVGLGRAHAYGPRFQEYVRELQEYAVVVVMIEHRDGVEQVEEILRVPGVDGVFIGPYDLSTSYGVPGQFEHPLMRAAMARILAAAKDARVAAGIHVVHPPVEQVKDRLAEGFRLIAYGGDMLFLVPAMREAVAHLRALGRDAR
jgi:2-keto-3-deoxy-L-rhamnonate aldolase RhmA